jgi:hypothetical protein
VDEFGLVKPSQLLKKGAKSGEKIAYEREILNLIKTRHISRTSEGVGHILIE